MFAGAGSVCIVLLLGKWGNILLGISVIFQLSSGCFHATVVRVRRLCELDPDEMTGVAGVKIGICLK